MEDSWLYQTTLQYSHYAPQLVILATWVDVFFLTGLVFNGFAMLGIAVALQSTGMIEPQTMIITAIVGTASGNILNYWIGRWFGTTTLVQKTLKKPLAQKTKQFLQNRGLFIAILIGRFVTVTRPFYALVLGSLGISFRQFFIRELFASTLWSVFWILVILQGEALVRQWMA